MDKNRKMVLEGFSRGALYSISKLRDYKHLVGDEEAKLFAQEILDKIEILVNYVKYEIKGEQIIQELAEEERKEKEKIDEMVKRGEITMEVYRGTTGVART